MRKGTLIVLRWIEDGLALAVDDLTYREDVGDVPSGQSSGNQKLFRLNSRLLLASFGLVECSAIEYKLERWVAHLIEIYAPELESLTTQNVATIIQDQIRKTLDRAESAPGNEIWQYYPPGGCGHLLTYIIAGNDPDGSQAVFEITVEVNTECQAFNLPPVQKIRQPGWLWGQRKHAARAMDDRTEEYLLFREVALSLTGGDGLNIPVPLQPLFVQCIASIYVESRFNPDRVGAHGTIGVMGRASSGIVLTF